MKQRVVSILQILKNKSLQGQTGSILDFKPTSNTTFELKLDITGKTFFTYEVGGNDELLRIELIHGFAHLDLSLADDPTQFLLEMLEENVPSFKGSSACLGLKNDAERRIVCLSSSHQFVVTISDADIAESLSVAIWDLKMAQVTEAPSPVVLWQ